MQGKIALIPKFLLFAIALTPLIVSFRVPFPFPLPKLVFFRLFLELALISVLAISAYESLVQKNFIEWRSKLYKNGIIILFGIFLFSMGISAILAPNSYRAFWGDIDRQTGLYAYFHYFVFLILVAGLFKSKDWLNFLKINLGVSAVLILYGILQFGGWFGVAPKARVESFIGNSAFFATHLIFTMLFCGIIFFVEKKFWKYAALVIGSLAFITIFLTGTRGAILGVLGGFLTYLILNIFNADSSRKRKIYVFILCVLFASGAIFWFTRTSSAWNAIPGLDRLSKTTFLGGDSASVRLLSWKLSWNIFKQKPIFGWGSDNFLYAYSKNFNPEFTVYGETWLDRAHNFALDLLVSGGVVGFIIYFLLLFWAVRTIFKSELSVKEKNIIIGGISAYLIQNIFLLDYVLSLLMFCMVLGYVISKRMNDFQRPVWPKWAFVPLGLISLGVLYLAVVYAYIPWSQSVQAQKTKAYNDPAQIQAGLNQAFYPYNFAQARIRTDLAEYFYENHGEVFENKDLNSVGDKVLDSQKEIISKEPYDPRNFILTAEIYLLKARTDENFYKTGEEILRKGLEISPDRQEFWYYLAFDLGAQGRKDESIAAAQHAVSLAPNVWRAHYYLGLVLAASGERNEAERELTRAEELNPQFSGAPSGDLRNLALIYGGWAENQKLAELILRVVKRSPPGDIFYLDSYKIALSYFIEKENAESVISIADFMGKSIPQLKDDMEILISMAEHGNWDAIRNQFFGN